MAELIVGLDISEKQNAKALVEQLGSAVDFYKIGSIPFTAFGPEIINKLSTSGKKVFLDLKFFDIPNTVEKSVECACGMAVACLTVHILGGSAMLKAAVRAKNRVNAGTKIIGVTMLTSFSNQDIQEIGFSMDINKQILKLAEVGYDNGLDGIVCSVWELGLLRKKFRQPFLMVCPGIRMQILSDDQKRAATVSQAIKAGADWIVVGRPVIESKNPLVVVEQIKREIKEHETTK